MSAPLSGFWGLYGYNYWIYVLNPKECYLAEGNMAIAY